MFRLEKMRDAVLLWPQQKKKGREADQQGMTSKLQYTVDRHAWSSQPEFIVLSIFQSSSSSSLFFGGGGNGTLRLFIPVAAIVRHIWWIIPVKTVSNNQNTRSEIYKNIVGLQLSFVVDWPNISKRFFFGLSSFWGRWVP